MNKTVVLDIVGLSASLIGSHTPFLKEWIDAHHKTPITPMLPAVTTAVQSTYLTGKTPAEHGIVGNGWYDRTEGEMKFWKQSNRLVQAKKIWEQAKEQDPNFTCANMCWWYNMNSSVDYLLTPRPNYLSDGRKIPDCYTYPAELRDDLRKKLGAFPLFHYWGPGADIRSSRWIAEASMITEKKYHPTLTLIYLPHLDYCLQKFGRKEDKIAVELQQIDALVKRLVDFYKKEKTKIILLSEYGICPVNQPVHLNRIFRDKGWLKVRVERDRELLDPQVSRVFAVADHQVAHVYVNDKSLTDEVKSLLMQTEGVAEVLDEEGKQARQIAHERAGDFVVIAKPDSWFTYYYWQEERRAPDFARLVAIHQKPGYDPVEMFMTSKLRAGYKLLRKKLGFRYLMDVVPLNAMLVKGSHGRTQTATEDYPVMITENEVAGKEIPATEVYNIIWETLTT